MKLLSIGNSFSQDAQKYLYQLSQMVGFDIDNTNLFYPGCSLKQHWDFFVNNEQVLTLEKRGVSCEQKISLGEALELDTFDVITLQQASHFSGVPKTYIPHLQNLAEVVRQKQPNAKIYFHQTWAYEKDFDRPHFERYDRNQHEMFRRLVDASEMASIILDAPIIPSGTVIQTLRDTVSEFDVENGGISLSRDGFHLSLGYGRFAAAATWLRTLCGKPIEIDSFNNFDPVLVSKILAVVEDVCKQ